MANGGFFEPIPIRYQGLYADAHLVDAQQFGTSVIGASRLANSACHFLFFEKATADPRLFQIRFFVGPSRENGLLQEIVAVLVNGQLPLFAGVLPTLAKQFVEQIVEAIINVALKKKPSENLAIEKFHDLASQYAEFAKDVHHGHMRDKAWLQSQFEELARLNRAPLRELPEPVGKSVRQMLIGSSATPLVIDEASAAVLRSKEEMSVTEAQEFDAQFDGVFKTNGECRLRIGHDSRIVKGKIVDPALAIPHNVYTTALDNGTPVRVTAKATLRNGEIDRLFISDAKSKD
jgi:hypothetical protein